MTDARRPGVEPLEFVVDLSSGRMVLRTEDVVSGRWTFERYARDGAQLHAEPVGFADIVALARWLRSVVRVERYDDEPDFTELAESFELRAPSSNVETLRFAWLYRALAIATTRGDERDKELLERLSECCAAFLEHEPDVPGLSHPSRKVSGKDTSPRWARLNEPIQRAMLQLADALVPVLREVAPLRERGSVAVRDRVSERCAQAFARFSGMVVWHVGQQLGTVRTESERVLKRLPSEGWIHTQQCAELEERILENVVKLYINAPDPQALDLIRVVELDPDDRSSVRSIVRLALGGFLSSGDVDSRIRTFKFAPLKDAP